MKGDDNLSVNIKALERQENDLYMQLDEMQIKRAEIDRSLASKKAELVKVQNRLKQLKSNVILTDHAIVRYLERVEKVDIEKIKKILLDEGTGELIKTMQPKKIKRDTYSLLVHGSTITTVVIEKK